MTGAPGGRRAAGPELEDERDDVKRLPAAGTAGVEETGGDEGEGRKRLTSGR